MKGLQDKHELEFVPRGSCKRASPRGLESQHWEGRGRVDPWGSPASLPGPTRESHRVRALSQNTRLSVTEVLSSGLPPHTCTHTLTHARTHIQQQEPRREQAAEQLPPKCPHPGPWAQRTCYLKHHEGPCSCDYR